MKNLRFSVHPFAASGIFLLLFAAPPTYAFCALSAVLLHEAGHTAMALLFHGQIRSIRLMPTGISISLSRASSYREEFFVALAGPLMNILSAILSPLFSPALSQTMLTVSLLLALINLLPIRTIDGGRMLGALISHTFGENVSEKVLSFTTAVSLSLIWMLSLYIFFYSGVNFTLLIFCAYLFSYLFLKKL